MKKEYILRIENDVYEELKNIADLENRSVNKEIEYIIKEYIALYRNKNNKGQKIEYIVNK